jgi:AraC-like DNA-binding protein
MDVLSDVLKSVSLDGALFLNAEFTAPWCIRGRYGRTSVRERLAGVEHVILFHFVLDGRCNVRLADSSKTIDVAAGDLVLFARDDRHVMGSDLHLAPIESDTFFADRHDGRELVNINHGGGGTATRLVCGYLAASRGLCRPLIESLPRVVRIPVVHGPDPNLLHDLVRAGVRESSASRPGRESALAKLAELVFVEALRRYVEELPAEGTGWLAGLRDEHVGRAIALFHGDPERAWTVDTLAIEVGLSRSALAERFVNLIGVPPIQYLARWRLALASRALGVGKDAISRVAERAGYASEASFSRAFKREFGVPPAAWRRSASAQAASGSAAA